MSNVQLNRNSAGPNKDRHQIAKLKSRAHEHGMYLRMRLVSLAMHE
jgi:hypothetical protein